jgi:hypothetical protein
MAALKKALTDIAAAADPGGGLAQRSGRAPEGS